MIKKIQLWVCALFLMPIVACQAQTAESFVAGDDYTFLPQPVNMRSSKIVVTEVFWYGCSHCFTFETTAADWKASLPADVKFQQQPVIWRQPLRELHARAFYTAQALKVSDAVNKAMFEALNLKRMRMSDENSIAKVFADAGINADKFTKTFNSFGVNSLISQAKSLEAAFQVQATPEIIVNGKYKVTTKGGHERMLEVTSYLIDLERKALAAEK